jgi:multicomponent Na+:H+ antiporter subunit E
MIASVIFAGRMDFSPGGAYPPSSDARSAPSQSRLHMLRIRALWLGGLLFGAWLLWSGHYTPLLLSMGVLSCAAVLALSVRMRLLHGVGFNAVSLARLPGYLCWLIWRIVLANLDVARRILDPQLPISPTLLRLRVEARTEVAWVVFGNSITLTPGTVTIRLRSGMVLVHALTHESAEALVQGEMNRRVARLEGGVPCSP